MPDIYTEKALSGLAMDISKKLHGHENIYLSGDLGAGKTTFTKYLLANLGVQSTVKSPSYQLIDFHRFGENKQIAHVDLYRLNDLNDIASLGLDDILSDEQIIAIIEWPERAEHLLPAPHYHFNFTHRTPTTRKIQIEENND